MSSSTEIPATPEIRLNKPRRDYSEWMYAGLFLLPFVVIFGVLFIYPTIQMFLLSLTKISSKLGGYRSEQVRNGGEASVYGKYVEPVLHATEHLRRSLPAPGQWTGNAHEYARAKDELKSVGKGLHQMDHKYQEQAKGK